MENNSNPLDYLIQLCEKATTTGKWELTRFTILNAKDELKKLRQLNRDLSKEAFDANQFAVEEANKNMSYYRVASARINDNGDLYDLSIDYHSSDCIVVPLYANMEEFKTKHDELSE